MSVKFRVKKGDLVMVVAGKERGKSGKILLVDRRAGKVSVEKLNIVKRHTKPNAKNRQGGILEREGLMDISNVMPFCESIQKPSRIRTKVFEDGRKSRVYQKSPNESLDKA